MTTAAKNKVRKHRVSFSLDARHAQQVSLVGDFNAWDPGKHPMKRDADGLWEKTVILEPGTYEYKFHQDGQWIADPCNDRQHLNRFGTWNSIAVVAP